MCELESLRGLVPHPNIVELLFVIRDNDGTINFVFEYMETGSVHDILVERSKGKLGPLPDTEIRCILQQVIKGVAHLHTAGFLHRDLKPENILLHGKVCKVADFSLARGLDSKDLMTSYVSTRWYRAPEVLLAAPNYSFPVDLFAVGCIAAELYKLRPLFPGVNECDQLKRIFNLTGTPAQVCWTEGETLLKKLNVVSFDAARIKQNPSEILREWLREKSDGLRSRTDNCIVNFIGGLLYLNPAMRLTAEEALNCLYFRGINGPESIVRTALRPDTNESRERFSDFRSLEPLPILCLAAESLISSPTPVTKQQTPAKHVSQPRVQVVTAESNISYSSPDTENPSAEKDYTRRIINPYNKSAIRAGK